MEGPRFIADFLSAGLVPDELLLGDGLDVGSPLRSTDHVEVSSRALADISATEQSQGAIAIFPFPVLAIRQASPTLILVLDRVQDPGNVGTLIRSAAASGADGVWLTPGAADPFNPKVIRAAAAAHAAIDLAVGPPEELLGRETRLIVADGSAGATPLDDVDWSLPSIVALGNEGSGVSPELRERADLTVAIPMSPLVESLNVGVAGSIVLFEAARQRRMSRARTEEG